MSTGGVIGGKDKEMGKIQKFITIEEYWPGQTDKIRTARIEVWTDDEDQHYALEVGRITANQELFEELRKLIENAGPRKTEQVADNE